MPKGEFVFPETDQKLTVKPFNQAGKPYLWKPKEIIRGPEILEPTVEPKKSFMVRLLDAVTREIGSKKPEIISQKEYDRLNDLTENLAEKELIPEPKITKITKPRTKKSKAEPKQEPTKPKITMESLREVYSPDCQASKDYEA